MRTAVQPSPAPKPHQRETSLTKAWIIFANGNRITWYSHDSSGRYHVDKNRAYGIRGLKKRVLEAYSPVTQAHIYDNKTGAKLSVLKDGEWNDLVAL